MVFAYTIHATVFILYLMAFIRYRQLQTKTADLKREFRLMIQGTMGSFACFIFLTFHHVWRVPTVEFLAVLFCIGSDPFVYLGFNADIRNDFLVLIHHNTNKTIKTVIGKINESRIFGVRNRIQPQLNQ
uniref:7TM GPCR serpentine receptor class x (Srx) domain-containing protein n=1 Tax=Acrobeloides nanus TaxID=290746 RepID=A0A914EFL9_9BILA